MSVKGWQKYEQNYFGGSWTVPDRAAVDARGALLAQNVRYFKNEVATRYGWGVGASFGYVGAGISGPALNWLSTLGNFLVWADLGTDQIYFSKLTDNPPILGFSAAIPAAFVCAVFAPVGPRLYVANWTTGTGREATYTTAGPACISFLGASFAYDSIIPGPPSAAATGSGVRIPTTAPTEPSAGVVTAGTHYLGVRMLHRSGFLGRPGPDTSTSANPTVSSFAPIPFTSSGNKNLQWVFTPGGNWPTDVVQVQVVMSPVSNPNRFFLVPGAVQAVTGGSPTAVTVILNVSDDALIATATECTNSLNFYTASATGQAFMQCLAVAAIGNRMFYVSQLPDGNGNMFSVVFASDPYNYQQISLSQHALQIPNQLDIRAVIGLNNSIYLLGPHWTYMTQDNGGVPATWATPTIVDGRRGAVAPNCVEVATSGDYAWIADVSGLYLFKGSYDKLPISYFTSDWGSFLKFPDIFMQLKDDPLRHRVLLNSSQSDFGVRFIMEWDYTIGMDNYSVRYTRHDKPATLGGGIDNFGGAIEIVQNDLASVGVVTKSKVPELWWVPSSRASDLNLYVFREKNPAYEGSVYQDNGVSTAAIHAIYETNIFPSSPGSIGSDSILNYHAANIRITGNGNLTPQLFSFDKTTSANLPTLALAASPEGRQFIRQEFLSNGGFIHRFEQQVVGGFFDLEEITMFYTEWMSHP